MNSPMRVVEPASGAGVVDASGGGHGGVPAGVALGAAGIHPAPTEPSGPAVGSTATYVYDDADRLVSVAGHDGDTVGYAHDADGRTVEAGGDRYGWDLAGRMTGATVDGATSGFGYDGDGTRTTVTGPDGTVTGWQWDVDASLPLLALEGPDAGGVTARHLHGPAGPLAVDHPDTGAGRQWLTGDGLGTVTTVTDAAGGLDATHTYGAWGAPTVDPVDPAAATSQPWGFTGQYWEQGLGQYHLRARQYDPALGRFLTTDPLAPPVDDPYVSAYLYVANRPGVLVDPSGMIGVPSLQRACRISPPASATSSPSGGPRRSAGRSALTGSSTTAPGRTSAAASPARWRGRRSPAAPPARR